MSFVGLALVAGSAAAIAVPIALAGASQTPSGEQTHPRVTPRIGGKHRTFELTFTLAQAPGHSGTAFTEYRAVVSPPAHARAACAPTQPAPITSGSAGESERLALHPPTPNWCKGRYLVTVYLERTSTCGPPVGMKAAFIICPVTASGVEPSDPIPATETNTGEAHFKVR